MFEDATSDSKALLVFLCHTNFASKNITITASQDTSVSKLVGRMLENQMQMADEYWRAYEGWKKGRR